MNMFERLNNYRKYRSTVSELGRLSERELSDIGMSRGDIHAFARKAVYRKGA